MEILEERFQLTLDRIKEIHGEAFTEDGQQADGQAAAGSSPLWEALGCYMKSCAAFLLTVGDTYSWIKEGGPQKADAKELEERKILLYGDILPGRYGQSFANPVYAVEKLGEAFGQLLCFLYSELRSTIGFAYEQNLEDTVIRMELFVEIYNAFSFEKTETGSLPDRETIRQILYWFCSDYADVDMERRIGQQFTPGDTFAVDIVMQSDLEDLRYLYRYGEYVGDNELRTARYLNSLPEETVRLMADIYTEGYRIGFDTGNKDFASRRSVSLYYNLGFERVIRQAILNFEKLGLRPVLYRAATSLLEGKSLAKNGFVGVSPNKQYEYDHKDDAALFMDKQYINRRLEVLKAAFEAHREETGVFGGPAVMEVFGEEPFTPKVHPQACRLSEEQQRLSVEFRSASRELQLQYIEEKNRSFTIIAFPIPEIGEQFEEIFHEIIRINTLDYKLYRDIQQKLIDALDQSEHVTVKGMNGNRTDLKVMLHELQNPDKETIFENCVADVNIPVGEVFTSPKLTGTEGTLHVSRVFLNELEYKDLELTFKDGMIAAYRCGNYDAEEENRKFLQDNLLFNHETLPLGEFAIGTNTTAYMAAARYQMGDKLPILIAEKMGPHFAVGDTCYSNAEEIAVFNPDGKEIVARENEVSLLRHTPGSTAYYNCHTDITIPYDELGELAAVKADGTRTVLIEKGRFVLPGCETLNKPFEE